MSRKRHEKKEHRRRGGKSGERENEAGEKKADGEVAYNAERSNALKEAKDTTDTFKRGGHKKPRRKHGGKADGHRPHQRADKPRRARGGANRDPLSSARVVKTRPGMDERVHPDKSDD
jgi:hypothetical protein